MRNLLQDSRKKVYWISQLSGWEVLTAKSADIPFCPNGRGGVFIHSTVSDVDNSVTNFFRDSVYSYLQADNSDL
ncbi:hypothetical protein MASR1M107_00270 [Ignavibacteriales bacterium]